MNETLGEHISAFLDGELPAREVELLLKRLEREPHLRTTLSRYAEIGQHLRGEYGNLSSGFVANVSRSIALEHERGVAPLASKAGRRAWVRTAGRWAGGMALAATVAGVAILLLQREHSPLTQPPGSETQNDVQLVADAQPVARGTETVVIGNARGGEMYSYTVPAPVKTSPILPEARLTDYVFAHSEYSSPLGRRNVLSSVIAEDPTPVEPNEIKQRPAVGEVR